MRPNKDVIRLYKDELERAGIRYDIRNGSKHAMFEFTAPNGRHVKLPVSYGAHASRSPRALQNAKRTIRHALRGVPS